MFKSIKNALRGRKSLSKTQKVLNLLNKGEAVSWKTLRNKFDLKSPRAMVDKLRSQGIDVDFKGWYTGETKHILLCPSSPTVTYHINGISQQDWINQVSAELKKHKKSPVDNSLVVIFFNFFFDLKKVTLMLPFTKYKNSLVFFTILFCCGW